MITKERLEELVKQGATIYTKYRELNLLNFEQNLGDCGGKIYRKINIEDNKLKYTYDGEDYFYEQTFDFSDLFETEEEVEFILRFKRIPKTEYLDLPTWEEFLDGYQIHFRNRYKNYLSSVNDNHIRLLECYGMVAKPIFDKPLTKENYIEACELCRKLFLGEQV